MNNGLVPVSCVFRDISCISSTSSRYPPPWAVLGGDKSVIPSLQTLISVSGLLLAIHGTYCLGCAPTRRQIISHASKVPALCPSIIAPHPLLASFCLEHLLYLFSSCFLVYFPSSLSF